jgi:hypothetical protein
LGGEFHEVIFSMSVTPSEVEGPACPPLKIKYPELRQRLSNETDAAATPIRRVREQQGLFRVAGAAKTYSLDSFLI